MADDYPVIYRKQGSTEFVVGSGGLFTIEDGGKMTMPVVADTSSANLANFGVSTLTNASSAPTTFTLDAPAVGSLKTLSFDVTFGTTAIGYIDAGSGVTINTTNRYMSAKEAYGYATLVGLSTTKWAFIGHSTAVLPSTGAT